MVSLTVCLNWGHDGCVLGHEKCTPLTCPDFRPEEPPEMYYDYYEPEDEVFFEDEWETWEKNQLANEGEL